MRRSYHWLCFNITLWQCTFRYSARCLHLWLFSSTTRAVVMLTFFSWASAGFGSRAALQHPQQQQQQQQRHQLKHLAPSQPLRLYLQPLAVPAAAREFMSSVFLCVLSTACFCLLSVSCGWYTSAFLCCTHPRSFSKWPCSEMKCHSKHCFVFNKLIRILQRTLAHAYWTKLEQQGKAIHAETD